MSQSTVSRRSFFKKSVASLAGAGLIITDNGKVKTGPTIYLPKFPNPEDYKIKEYRPLGKLGFKASDISIGTTGTTDPSVISFALDCGVNFIETAYAYGNGKAEKDIGEAIKNKRDKLWVSTKFNPAAFRGENIEKSLLNSLDESLQRMKIDHVESVMVHNGKPEQLFKDELHSMFAKAKQAGKVKYLGVSLHDADAAAVLEKTINDNRFDIILTVYGAYSAQTTEHIFKAAHDIGKAIIAMKTLGAAYNAKVEGWDKLKASAPRGMGMGERVPQRQGAIPHGEGTQRTQRDSIQMIHGQMMGGQMGGGGMGEGHGMPAVEYTQAFIQSAFAWVLKNPYVSVLVKRMNSFEDVKNSLAASGVKFGALHQQFLDHYGSLIKGNYCKIGCGDCLGSCPNNVAINDIMRYKMYFENYRSEKEGIVNYKELPVENRADTCKDCNASCRGACPAGVNIQSALIQAHEMLTI